MNTLLSLKSSLSPISRLQLKLFVELLSLAIGVALLIISLKRIKFIKTVNLLLETNGYIGFSLHLLRLRGSVY